MNLYNLVFERTEEKGRLKQACFRLTLLLRIPVNI